MPQPAPHITEAELKILKVLWEIQSGTVRDVLERLSAGATETPAYTTVMTLMNQLAAKGGLHVDRDRQPFFYKPALRRDQVLGQRLRQFLQTVFDGQAGDLVLRLVEDCELSADELKRIEALIETRERADMQEKNPDAGNADQAGSGGRS